MKLSQSDLALLVEEMRPALLNSRLENLWRSGPEGYGLLFRKDPEGTESQFQRVQVDVSLHKDFGRVAARQPASVDKKTIKERKKDSTAVLQKLRRCLKGAKLERLEMVPNERILLFAFDARQEDGLEEIEKPIMAVELTGNRTNLVLMDEADCIVVVHRHGRGQGGRDLVAGITYELPKNLGRDDEPTELTEEQDPVPLGLNERVGRILREAEQESRNEGLKARYLKAVRTGLKRLKGRLSKLEREIEEARSADALQREGELLKIYATQIPKDAKEYKALDEFEQPPVERLIKIDKNNSPLDQAAKLFKRAKKLRRALPNMEMRCGQGEADRDELQALLLEIEGLEDESPEALKAYDKKLKQFGCQLKDKTPAKKPTTQANQGPRRFTSSDGLTIMVGRSNRENDQLSLRIARGNDLFFHVRGSPGSHVVVRKPRDKSVPLETLLDAGTLAVHFSKRRGSTKAEVSYTPCKYVRKPKGAKAGLVTISNEKTLCPGADPERLQRLLSSRVEQGS